MVESVFEGIGTYITRRHNTAAQYITTQLIMDLCERSAWRQGKRVSRLWWEQKGLYFEGVKKRAAEAVESGGEEVIGEEKGMPLEMTTGWE